MKFPYTANPFKSKARRGFRLGVPDEWYRRSKSRNVSSAVAPSDSTIKRLAALQESDEEGDEEGEGTAKMGEQKAQDRPNSAKTVEQRGIVTQSRLSNIFEGWLNSPPSSPNRNSAIFSPENRKSVSEPKLLDKGTNGMDGNSSESSDDGDEERFEKEFEDMLVSNFNKPEHSVIHILLRMILV